MPDLLPESVIILLDASRSMFRTDYSPNRLEACKTGIMNLIQTRAREEAMLGGTSAYGIIALQGTPRVLLNFNDFAPQEQIQELLKTIGTKGASPLGEGIALAIKVLIEDIRTSGARFPHIIIFSDGKSTASRVDALKMANLSSQTGMRIDTVRLGEVAHVNILKQVAETSNGQYFFANNVEELQAITTQLASPNIMPSGSSYAKKTNIVSRKVLKKIALPLQSESEMNKGSKDQKSLISRIRGTKSYQKCSICFQSNDPVSKTNFSRSGRYCPNCGTPMHGSCASLWGHQQDKEGDGTVFRCVHCLYLLKIPASVQTAVQMHRTMQKEIKSGKRADRRVKSYNVTPQVANTLGDSALYSACPVCNGIFDEDEQVVQCGNPDCNTIYHLNHFEELPDHTCKICGAKMTRLFG